MTLDHDTERIPNSCNVCCKSLGEEVSKVKKRTGVTGERNVKGSKKNQTGSKKKRAGKTAAGKNGSKTRTSAAGKRSGTVRAVERSGKKKPVRSMRNTKVVKASKVANATKVAGGAAREQRVAITPLDPVRKCGPGTSVQFLYRVDESVEGRRTAHLVFFDRHGWYCEHGRTCPAVGHAKKYNGQIARVS